MPARALSASLRAVLVLLLATVAAGCSGGAVSAPTGSGEAPTPSASGPTGCAAAPAPPVNQEGWTTASSEPTVFPVIVNSSGSLTCGENRLVFTFLDLDNRPVGHPDRAAAVELFNLGRDGATPASSGEGTFVWGIEGERGFYVATVTFAEAGIWGAEFTTSVAGGAPEKIRMTFEVSTSTSVVRVGDPARPSTTPTAASVGGELERISTDSEPDPAFYERSVDEALAAHEAFLLVFATPLFCLSAQCGPTLDVVKPLAAAFPEVRFIHVEPYELTFADGGLQPVRNADGQFVPTQSVLDWGLLSEPWVFVVDSQGIVRGSFEGAVGEAELRAALEAVS
ncbi:MAG TPA: hypothetical protein VFX65_04245 [Candidatus Limnocylindrales bacterium]|nr:hypothetical protein [Candidatus Limnocylindrales bacterium]